MSVLEQVSRLELPQDEPQEDDDSIDPSLLSSSQLPLQVSIYLENN